MRRFAIRALFFYSGSVWNVNFVMFWGGFLAEHGGSEGRFGDPWKSKGGPQKRHFAHSIGVFGAKMLSKKWSGKNLKNR